MKNIRWGFGFGFFIFLSIILLMGLSIEKRDFKDNYIDEMSTEEKMVVDKQWNNPLNEVKLVDKKEIYDQDKDSHVDEIYVTVLPPGSKDVVTFEELNVNINSANEDYISDAFDPVVEIIFEADKPNKDNVLSNKPNATMEIRGQSARIAEQKSYKIKLYDDTNKWHGFKIINLNKHFLESLRIRNKLSFDYFERLPDFISIRTRFVKLYIKDLSSPRPDNKFNYYGLYTFIEQPNKRLLKRHGLDPNGHLYKAEYFEFFRYPDRIKSKEDITYDDNKFERILEIRGNENHEKLIEMLEAVNDYNRNINEVVDKYFDRDNMLTWLSVNILMDNYDTNSQNYLLYSPLNSDKWFFLPWDYDKGWKGNTYRPKWQEGLSNYWGMVLFRRFFKDTSNVKELSKKIEEVSEIVNEENTLKYLESYYNVVKENVFVPPDWKYLKTTVKEYNEELYFIAKIPAKRKKYYYKSLEYPMPFFLGEPKYDNGGYKFNWDPAFDLQGDDITYTFLLSTDYRFKNIITEYNNLRKTSCTVTDLKPGTYFWKVRAYDSKGNWQEAFDYCKIDGHTIFGVNKLTVK